MPRKAKVTVENVEKNIKQKPISTKKVSKTNKKNTTRTSTKKTSISKTKNVKKSSSSKTNKVKKSPSSKSNNVEILEYYDLPYRYNQTVVKILAQTPNTLFVYWDISDEDKNNYIKKYGEFFFNNTKPVLIVHNLTNNYSFEIDINDFANSWYLHVNDAKCDYSVELGRRPINEYVSIPNNYLHISNSNSIESPNDHILFEKFPRVISFKNVKTNKIINKSIINYLSKITSTYNIKGFYKEMYSNEDFDFDKLNLRNPSSMSSSKFI